MRKAVLTAAALTLGFGAATLSAKDAAPPPPARPGQQIHLGPAPAPGTGPSQAGLAASGSPAAPAAGAADPAVDALLDALDKRGQALRGFDADVTLVEKDTTLQTDTTRTGHVWYQKLPDGDERIHVVFDKRINGKQQFAEKIEYLLEKGWLLDRDYQKRIEVRRQVLRPGQKANLLKLGEGPFPLPIGQKKEDVKRLFEVKLAKPDPEDDPKGGPAAHLRLKPVPETQFSHKFATIDVWVDPQSNMPKRIDTLDRNRVVERSTDLSKVRLNPDLGDGDFTPEKIKPETWNVHEEPFAS